MMLEEMLLKAAARSNEIYVNYFESKYDPISQHEFSPQFENKIAKLKRRAKRPFFYSPLQRVASVVLAVVLSVSVWLTVDADAREAFFGWIKEFCGTVFVYRYEGTSNENVTPKEYQLTWIPDGYTEFFVDEKEASLMAVYSNENGSMLTFRYIHNPDETNWFVDASQMTKKQTTVNGNSADLLILKEPTVSSIILWTTPDNTAFYISAFLSDSDLIKIAESVREK